MTLGCKDCGNTSSPFFIVIGDKAICIDCKNSNKGKVKMPSVQRVFTRYVCKTHNCGSYSVSNMFFKHEIFGVCFIVEEQTLGISRPATYGGLNGDISRKYFLKPKLLPRLLDNLDNYVIFENLKRNKYNRRARLTPRDHKKLKKNANRYRSDRIHV